MLGDFLRARRARIRPEDKGLATGPRRRTQGLRREEVAQLACISPSWYTRLEQGRAVEPSSAVLKSIADALELDAVERRYVSLLALGRAAHRDQPLSVETIAGARELLASLDPHPAYAADAFGEVYGCNDAAREWLTDFTAPGARERNVFDWMIHDPEARERLPAWAAEVQDVLARYRGASPLWLGDPRAETFLDRMRRQSPEAWAMWRRHEVRDISSRIRLLRHPELGVRRFRLTVLLLGGADRIGVVLHTPA